MLRHTQKIKELYEGIKRHIYSMIPEKWESLYLYASVIEGQKETGELYFYYVPKGILKKKPVNVYEIPSKFNIDETEYLKLETAWKSKEKSLACKLEYQIKQLSKQQKEKLINGEKLSSYLKGKVDCRRYRRCN